MDLDKHAARVTVSIEKALEKPQLLSYMRKQILEDITNNLTTLTDEEILQYMKEHHSDEIEKVGSL